MTTSLGLLLLALACLAPISAAAGPRRGDMAARDAWMRERLQGEALPFSFALGGARFVDLAPAWRLTRKASVRPFCGALSEDRYRYALR
jgi:hypothetical protein